MPKIDVQDVPELGGWVTIQRAADAIGLSRQAISKKVHEGEVPLDSVRRLSYGPGARNDLLVVSVEWVRKEIERQRIRAEERRAKLDARADAAPELETFDDEVDGSQLVV